MIKSSHLLKEYEKVSNEISKIQISSAEDIANAAQIYRDKAQEFQSLTNQLQEIPTNEDIVAAKEMFV